MAINRNYVRNSWCPQLYTVSQNRMVTYFRQSVIPEIQQRDAAAVVHTTRESTEIF